MAEFFLSLYQYAVKFVFLAAVAVLGVVAGKKYRDHKDAKNNVKEQ